MIREQPKCLDEIRVPNGDTADSIRLYQEYVCERIAEDLSFDEIRELLAYFHCPIDLLSDKIVEAKLRERRTVHHGRSGIDAEGRRALTGATRDGDGPEAHRDVLRELLADLLALTQTAQNVLDHQQETAQLLQELAQAIVPAAGTVRPVGVPEFPSPGTLQPTAG